jgi:putative DNA primase/helicase
MREDFDTTGAAYDATLDDSDIPAFVEPTEDAVAQAFAESNAGKCVYDHTAGRWFRWTNNRWQRDGRCSVFHCAREFARIVNSRLEKPSPDLAKIRFVSSVERAAKADPKIAVSQEIWDTDPWLLGTPEGVIDLRTGIVSASSPDLYISRHTTIAPASAGTPAPLWQAFLDGATKQDKELQSFLQRMSGYAMTGHVNEEVLGFLYGTGGNGKGVFLGTIAGILGEYAISVPIEVFTAGSRINLEYYRAQMAGTRLVTASETERQATWAESQIKEMTGNETPISARHPYGQPFTYRPQFKIVIMGNHAPKLKGRSPAMERRLRIVPFNHKPEIPDLDLKEKLKPEYPAILRWMVDGCLLWRKDRLGTADAIMSATSEYFEREDAFGRWMDERCILDESLQMKPGKLLADFNAWAKDGGDDEMDSKSFAEMIDRTDGLTRGRSNGVRHVAGIGLQTGRPAGSFYEASPDGMPSF